MRAIQFVYRAKAHRMIVIRRIFLHRQLVCKENKDVIKFQLEVCQVLVSDVESSPLGFAGFELKTPLVFKVSPFLNFHFNG